MGLVPLLGACQAQPFGDASGKASRTVSAFFHGQGPKDPVFFFREAWDRIYFFREAMSSFEDEQLEGKGSHLKR